MFLPTASITHYQFILKCSTHLQGCLFLDHISKEKPGILQQVICQHRDVRAGAQPGILPCDRAQNSETRCIRSGAQNVAFRQEMVCVNYHIHKDIH